MIRLEEILGEAGLTDDAGESAGFQLAVVRHGTATVVPPVRFCITI
jgi:hypothetical protein